MSKLKPQNLAFGALKQIFELKTKRIYLLNY
jgi:hypothetical protein